MIKYDSGSIVLVQGDCNEVVPDLIEQFDAVVTDPPYALSFMNKNWDKVLPSVCLWKKVLDIMKPGAFLLSFGGTRTFHRLTCNIEDAGFEIRDCIMWVYGSGWPKAANVLKPAYEPIIMARKPIKGTVVENMQEYGTGGLNIDDCRIEGIRGSGWEKSGSKESSNVAMSGKNYSRKPKQDNQLGRWPANIIHDGSEELLKLFPESKGQQASITGKEPSNKTKNDYGKFSARTPAIKREDVGSAARFFFCAKVSSAERKLVDGTKHDHPTTKPLALMRYLCRLITPPNGLILDPFAGSGTTLIAAREEGFRAIGIEQDSHYCDIATKRLTCA